MPIFDRHRVDMVLNGHDHDYERTKPMRGNQAQASAADGTIYVVSGGAGAELYENGSDFWTETSASLHSATVVRVRATSAMPIATGARYTTSIGGGHSARPAARRLAAEVQLVDHRLGQRIRVVVRGRERAHHLVGRRQVEAQHALADRASGPGPRALEAVPVAKLRRLRRAHRPTMPHGRGGNASFLTANVPLAHGGGAGLGAPRGGGGGGAPATVR